MDQLRRDRIIAVWLFVMCALVFVMVVLGGLTRLTHSGLSMVEWRPLTGWLPPMTEDEWLRTFEAYKQYPQFQKVFPYLDLTGFKGIFWLEFIHRLWGRMLGVAFLAPFAFFALRGWVGKPLFRRLAMLFVLGGLQGALGWYMVKSGLVDHPDVSQYRLTAHLGLAVALHAYMLWVGLGLFFQGPAGASSALSGLSKLLTILAFVTILSGGFVAGLDAGFAYNTFPLMEGDLVPDGLFVHDPAWRSVFEDPTTVQFDHRVLAMATFGFAMWLWWKGRRAQGRARVAANATGLMALVQVGLGISTLVMMVPVPLASAHQAGAVLLLSAMVWAAFEMRPT